MNEEIYRIYLLTGEKSVLPETTNGVLTKDGETYYMSGAEYTRYQKTYGKTAYDLLNSIFTNGSYKNLFSDPVDAQKVIEEVYAYAKAKANKEFYNGRGENYEYTSNWMIKAEEAEKQGVTSIPEFIIIDAYVSNALENERDKSMANKMDIIDDATGEMSRKDRA